MIPIGDVNPTRSRPYLTYGLIGINVIVFLFQMGMSERDLFLTFIDQSVVPVLVTQNPFSFETFLDLTRSMFFHSGILHIASNMLYLWVFGDNLEDRLGKFWFLVVYFLSGYGAAIAQVLIEPTSQIPLVGASGAIAGVLGGYLILYPRARVRTLIIFFFFGRLVELPAVIVLGFWFVIQLFNGLASLGVQTVGGGVAFFAHIGGFVVGLALTWLLNQILPPEDKTFSAYPPSPPYGY